MDQRPRQQDTRFTDRLKFIFGAIVVIAGIAHLVIGHNYKKNPQELLFYWRLSAIFVGLAIAGYGATEVYETRPRDNDANQPPVPPANAAIIPLPPQIPDYSQSASLSTAQSTSLSASSQTVSSNNLPPATLRLRNTGADKPANNGEEEHISNDA